MTNTQPEYFEDMYPDAIKNIYTQATIDEMVNTMLELRLTPGSEEYLSFCVSIKEAIKTYEETSGNKYKFSNSHLKNELEENDLIKQMQEFNAQQNNVVSINDGLEYTQPVENQRTGIKSIVNKILKTITKKS